MNTNEQYQFDALMDWWMATAQLDAEKVVPKTIEYGAGDLEEIGRTMARLAHREVPGEQEATELGIYYYVIGKIARWTAAIEHGQRVSDDTLLDLCTYLMMARRSRDVGGWPWATDEQQAPATVPTESGDQQALFDLPEPVPASEVVHHRNQQGGMNR